MVAVAEETGRLDKELVRLSIAYEAELDRHLRMLVALAEPLLLFVMAGVIGTVVVGMLLPVFMLAGSGQMKKITETRVAGGELAVSIATW